MNKKHIPYTYRIQCIPTQEYYYGVRYATNCNPDDLWVKYFTSSKAIHRLIKQYGKDAFVCEIRKTFDSAESAIKWETRVNTRTIKFSNYLNKNNGHRFSNEASIKGGQNGAIATKGSVWWNNGMKNTRSHICPGSEWCKGYIRGVVHDKVSIREKGVKLHWWNNGVKNVLSTRTPGTDWARGMVSGKRHWWNNGTTLAMSEKSPGPGWRPGYPDGVKEKLSKIAIAGDRDTSLIDIIVGRKTRGPARHPKTEDQKKSYLGIVWWTNGEEELKSKIAPNATWHRGRLINKFNNNRGSNWWTNGEEEIRTHEILSSEWIIGRKPRQLS